MKLILTDKARQILSEDPKYQGKYIRLKSVGACCCGTPTIELKPDKYEETDELIKVDNISFVVDIYTKKNLGVVNVDFKITMKGNAYPVVRMAE